MSLKSALLGSVTAALFFSAGFPAVYAQSSDEVVIDSDTVVILEEEDSTPASRTAVKKERAKKAGTKQTQAKSQQRRASAEPTRAQENRNERMYAQNEKKSSVDPYVAFRTAVSLQKNHIDDNVWANAGAIGIRHQDFRAEIEYTYREKMSGMSFGDYDEITTQSLMVNLYYDIPTETVIRPFINAGLGVSNIALRTPYYKDSTNKFSWSAGAGIAYDISKQWDFDIGYRYIDIGEDVKTNEFYAGIRYTF